MTRASLAKVQELIDSLPDQTPSTKSLADIFNRSIDDGMDDQGALSRIVDPQLFIMPEHSHRFIDSEKAVELFEITFVGKSHLNRLVRVKGSDY
jgi:hypothetical protein